MFRYDASLIEEFCLIRRGDGEFSQNKMFNLYLKENKAYYFIDEL